MPRCVCGYLRKGQVVGVGERCFAHPPVSWWPARRGVAKPILCRGCWKSPGTTSKRADRRPTAGPALLLRGLATGFPTADQTGHPLSRRASPDRRLGHLVPARGWAVDLGRFDGGRGQRQTGVGSVYQTLASSSHHRLVPVSRSVSPRQVCQNHFAQCSLRGGLQEPARSTGHSQSADASLSHLLARRPARVRRGDATVVRVLDVGFASGFRRSLPSVCRPLKRPRVDTDLHSSPSGWTRPNLCGMMDAPCNGCWKAPPPSGWGRNKAIRPTGRLPYRGWRLPPHRCLPLDHCLRPDG